MFNTATTIIITYTFILHNYICIYKTHFFSSLSLAIYIFIYVHIYKQPTLLLDVTASRVDIISNNNLFSPKPNELTLCFKSYLTSHYTIIIVSRCNSFLRISSQSKILAFSHPMGPFRTIDNVVVVYTQTHKPSTDIHINLCFNTVQ